MIMGAAGRDFHNFNMLYRDHDEYEVVAFTATQIPNISGRKYPAALAGRLYPDGIPIFEEREIERLIQEYGIQEVVFSYSDVSYKHVMSLSSRVTTAGAHFKLLSVTQTMLRSKKPVIAVCAVRTGSGKSQTCRKVSRLLRQFGFKVGAVRHPMPYGNLEEQAVQRFASIEDLHRFNCTIEEMEEYEPHIVNGTVVYAGVDYEAILRLAESEVDVILWDGGNNDTPFFEPDLSIVVADPLRVGNELTYYPSEANLRMANVVIINKVDSAEPRQVFALRENIRSVNANATIIEAASPISAEQSELIAGKRVLVIEDGPTLTHGEMTFGAGTVAAQKFGAAEIIDPRPYAVGEISTTFTQYPGVGALLPAMGYSHKQMRDLEATVNAVPCDLVIIGTPVNLKRILSINKPALRVFYDLEEIGEPNLATILKGFTQHLEELNVRKQHRVALSLSQQEESSCQDENVR
jgi:predicted GTPase